jgi:hypothetical protein
MSMTKDDAQKIALDFVKVKEREAGCELVLVGGRTIERAFGWVFFYDSKRHVETGSVIDALAGNAPFVVTRADGRVHETGTAQPVEHYLREFEK